jgi:hypothetical protein
MNSIYGNAFNRSGVYGAPLAVDRLNGKKIPENPRVITPETARRDGGGIENWEGGDKNNDLIGNVSP